MGATNVGLGNANSLNQILLRKYGDLSKIFNSDFFIYDKIKRAKGFSYRNRDFVFAIYKSRSFAAGGYPEGGAFPVGQTPVVSDGTSAIRRVGGTVQLTGNAMESGGPGASYPQVASYVQFNMESCMDSIKRTLNLAMWGFPDRAVVGGGAPTDPSLNGVLCLVSGVTGAGPFVITATRPLGYDSSTMGIPNLHSTRYLEVGLPVVWGTIAGNAFTYVGSGVVSGVDYGSSTGKATLTKVAGGDPLATHWVIGGSSAATNDFQQLPWGLGALVDQAADSGGANLVYEGNAIEPANARGWATLHGSAAGGVFTQPDWHNLIAGIKKVGNGKPSLMVTDPSFKPLYADTLSNDIRFEPEQLPGGYMKTSFASGQKFDWIMDNYCPYGLAFFLDEGRLFWLKQRELSWDKTDNGGIIQQTPGKDEFNMYAKTYLNLGLDSLNAHGVYGGVTMTAGQLFA